MKTYILGTGNISPQPVFDNSRLLDEIRDYNSTMLHAAEPDYKAFIKPMQLRRMSHLLKMGTTAAMLSLQDAGIDKVDAIITGTGLGMMEETDRFLESLVENGEKLLNPTAFIQSTHNTVAAHIAVMLQCNQYNNTFVHGPFSFESALLDSMIWLAERPGDKVLAGGVDEITEKHFEMMDTLGWWKKEQLNCLELFRQNTPGTIAGEGAAFFVLGDEPGDKAYACLQGLVTFVEEGGQEAVYQRIGKFLERHGALDPGPDLVLLGSNGDSRYDGIYDQVSEKFGWNATGRFKHLCGEHFVATSFALWLAARILKEQKVPEALLSVRSETATDSLQKILIYNNHRGGHHSLILLSAG